MNFDISITRSHNRYGECSISHGVWHGNDFSDGVVTRRDRSLLVIRVRDHIDRVHVVVNDLIESE